MLHRVYTVKDKAAGAYLQPIFTQTEATALRSLREAVSDPRHTFHRNASDYSLYYLGLFDDVQGKFSVTVEPEFVCSLETLAASISQASNG